MEKQIGSRWLQALGFCRTLAMTGCNIQVVRRTRGQKRKEVVVGVAKSVAVTAI